MQTLAPPSLETSTMALYAAQAAVAASIGLAILLLGRGRDLRALTLWGAAGIALAAHHAGAAASVQLAVGGGAGWVRTVASATSLAAGYLYVVWFGAGHLLAAGLARPSARAVRILTLAALAFGLASIVPFAGAPFPSTGRILFRIGLRTAVQGSVFVALGVLFIQARRRGNRRATLPLAVATLLIGLQNLDYALSTFTSFGLIYVIEGPTLRLVDLLLATSAGMAMIAWVADLERTRGERAVRAERRTAHALEEERERAHLLYRSALDLIAEIGDDGAVLRLSPASETLLGIDPEEGVGLNVLDLVHPADRVRAAHALRTADGKGTPLDLRMQGPRGDWRWLEVVGRPLEQGGRRTMVVTARDITERKELNERLTRAQKLEVTGRLVGSIAHDFNNVLTVVQGQSELILDVLGPEHTEIRDDLASIREASDQAKRLVQRLLAFTRRGPSHKEVLDLNAVVDDLCGGFVGRLLGDDVTVTHATAAEALPVRVDHSELESVILNLAVNAREAMPDGGTLRIHTRRHAPEAPGRPGPVAVLEMADSGCGIPEEVRDQVFEPFFTTKGSHGTGLGLATVQGVVHDADGWVEIDSAPGSGTTFRVMIPLAGAGGEEGAPAPPPAT